MKHFLFILLLLVYGIPSYTQLIVNPFFFGSGETPPPVSDTARFNFNLTARSLSGWADGSNHPSAAIRTVSQKGITVSSRSTSLWTATSGTTAVTNGGQTTGTYTTFPQNVVVDYWYSTQTTCADGNEQLEISGLVPLATYKLRMLGSRLSSAVGDTQRDMYYVVKHNSGRTTSTIYDVKGNTSNLREFTVVANGSGILYLGFYGAATFPGSTYGYINGLEVISNP